MTKASPLFCEVVGAPGFGKSTFVANVTNSAQKHNFYTIDSAMASAAIHPLARWTGVQNLLGRFPFFGRSMSRDKKRMDEYLHRKATLAGFIDFTVENGPYVQCVLDAISTVSDPAERRLVFTWMVRLFSKYQQIKILPNDGKIILMDEAFVGRVVTLFAYREAQATQEEIRNYVQLMPKLFSVIKLNVPVDEAYSRLTNRKRNVPRRFRPLSVEGRHEILRNCERCLDITITELKKLGVRVIEIDGMRDPQEQVATATTALKSMLEGVPVLR